MTIHVGNNVVNVAIASLTTVVAIDFLPAGSAVTVATVVTSVLVLIVGEIVPKSYGLSHARTWSVAVARPIQVVGWLLYPVVAVFDAVTRYTTGLIGGETEIENSDLEQ